MSHDIIAKHNALTRIYRVYQTIPHSFDMACSKGCATCCTRNVTLTTLEAWNLITHLSPDERSMVLTALTGVGDAQRLIPKITINTMADYCMEGRELPDEPSDPSWGPCPLLTETSCPVYQLRPFACRCMVSSRPCNESGVADMDEFTVTVNNVMMQYIEHVDAGGFTGNVTDMLLFMGSAANRKAYEAGTLTLPETGFVPNRPASVLMIPPEHRERIRPLIEALNAP